MRGVAITMLAACAVGCGPSNSGDGGGEPTTTALGTESGDTGASTTATQTSSVAEVSSATDEEVTEGSLEGPPADLPSCEPDSTTSSGSCSCAFAPEWQERPHSELISSVLSMLPAGARMELTSILLEHVGDPAYFFSTARELDALEDGVGEWNREYSEILDGILDAERCGVHVGNNPWPESGNWHSLYMRAYILAESPPEIIDAIECLGPALVEGVGASFRAIELEELDGWERARVSYDVFYGDYGGTANVDFLLQDHCDGTLGIVFMYPNGVPFEVEPDVEAISSSVCVTTPDTMDCCMK